MARGESNKRVKADRSDLEHATVSSKSAQRRTRSKAPRWAPEETLVRASATPSPCPPFAQPLSGTS